MLDPFSVSRSVAALSHWDCYTTNPVRYHGSKKSWTYNALRNVKSKLEQAQKGKKPLTEGHPTGNFTFTQQKSSKFALFLWAQINNTVSKISIWILQTFSADKSYKKIGFYTVLPSRSTRSELRSYGSFASEVRPSKSTKNSPLNTKSASRESRQNLSTTEIGNCK